MTRGSTHLCIMSWFLKKTEIEKYFLKETGFKKTSGETKSLLLHWFCAAFSQYSLFYWYTCICHVWCYYDMHVLVLNAFVSTWSWHAPWVVCHMPHFWFSWGSTFIPSILDFSLQFCTHPQVLWVIHIFVYHLPPLLLNFVLASGSLYLSNSHPGNAQHSFRLEYVILLFII